MNDRKIYVGESFESKEVRAIMPIEGKMPPFSEEQLHVSRMEKEELEKEFESGKLHPADLKNSVADYLEKIIAPIRKNWK